VSSSTQETPGTERWEKKARFTSCTNDLRIVFSERRTFGGTTAIADPPAKQTSDDRFGCPDESPAASIRSRTRSGFFSIRNFPYGFVRASAACSSRRFGGVIDLKFVVEFVLGLVVGAIALW
jgi:hypothetical protein